MADVTLRGVEKRWGGFVAVQHLDLDVEDSDFLVLLGPSGCGKTTTMRMIAGLEPLTAGEILIGGHRVNDRPARDRDIAMMFQNYGFYPPLHGGREHRVSAAHPEHANGRADGLRGRRRGKSGSDGAPGAAAQARGMRVRWCSASGLTAQPSPRRAKAICKAGSFRSNIPGRGCR